jgi:hypothetical protein
MSARPPACPGGVFGSVMDDPFGRFSIFTGGADPGRPISSVTGLTGAGNPIRSVPNLEAEGEFNEALCVFLRNHVPS